MNTKPTHKDIIYSVPPCALLKENRMSLLFKQNQTTSGNCRLGWSSKKSSNQVSNTVTSVYVNGVKQNYVAVEIGKHYWIIRKKNMYKADNVTQVKKIFPDKSKRLKNSLQTIISVSYQIQIY